MSKYNSLKVVVDGMTFDSRKEAKRYIELRLLERAGEISELRRQVKYVLIPAQREPDTFGERGGRKPGKLIERECAYIADFVYNERHTGYTVVEDVKGYKNSTAYEVFVIKRKLMLSKYGIKIREL